MNQQLRKKIFCLILGLTMIFSQMGFAFADTLGLNQTEDTGQTEILPAAGDLQTAEEPQMSDETQESEEPEKADPPSEAEEEASADNGEDKTPTTAIKIADTTLPQIIPNAMLRMVYQGEEAVKMSEAFVYTESEAEGEDGTWTWASYTPEGGSTAVSCETLKYYIIEDGQDWNAFARCVNEGNSLNEKTVVLTQNVDLSSPDFQPVGKLRAGTQEERYRPQIVTKFSGIFDGQGNTLKLAIDDSEQSYEGISVAPFACIENAVIKNLNVEGTMTIKNFHDGSASGGGISPVIGHLAGTCEVSRVVNNCDVKITKADGKPNSASGIVGTVGLSGTATLRNCANYGDISTEGSGSSAGMIAQTDATAGDLKLINCFNEGKITAKGGSANQIAPLYLSKFKEVRGCYGADDTNDLFDSFAKATYDKRSLVTAYEATKGATYNKNIHSWKTVWLLNQADPTPAYTLKDGKLQWAGQDDPLVYRVDWSPYGSTTTITPSAEEPKEYIDKDATSYYVADGAEITLTLRGGAKQTPLFVP